MKALRIFPLGISLVLVACGHITPPVLINGSEQGVVVRYSQATGDAKEADIAADTFCARYGRRAVAGIGDASTGDTFVSYTCAKR